MMAAYQPQPGVIHPAMAPHGHPGMAGVHQINPAQMQMGHPGAVTPGPHVTQAGAMMAMQPGAGVMGAQHAAVQMGALSAQMGGQSMAGGVPAAHAMSQMNPQAAMQQQQQMMQHIAHPSLSMHQQQQQQQHAAAVMRNRMASIANANQSGIPQGAMQGLNPQQIQQMQQQNSPMHPQGFQLPPHIAQQQLQLRMMAQQQQVMAQNQQAQQQLAMQQQAQNGNQPGQAAVQSQQANQQQHAGQPMRPQSRMANPNEQSANGPQQNAQGQQPNTPQSQNQQQQTPNAQQQGQQQNAGQVGQSQQAMTPQQMQAFQRQRQNLMQQQNAVLQRQMQAHQAQAQQQQQQGQGGLFLLKVILFGDHLSTFDANSGKEIANWHSFVDKFFAPDARLIHSFAPAAAQEERGKKKEYEVPRATIARYFQMYFDSNASYIRLHLEQGRETQMQPNRQQVSFAKAILTVAYPNGARLEMKGHFTVLFSMASDSPIELMELHTDSTEEHVTRVKIEEVVTSWSPTMSNKASPKLAKNKLPKAQQKMQQAQLEGLTIDHFPRVSTGKLGITERVQQFLEIDETMNVMADLIAFAQERKVRPEQAMEAIVAQYEISGGPVVQQGNPQINLPVNGVAVGNRTPSMQHMQMANAHGGNAFSSPSVSNVHLPMQNGMGGMNGSPHIAHNAGLVPNVSMPNSHTPSPHLSNMAAPAMMPQHSQQGTNSSAASANTSPNNNGKRRRSTVKLEGEDGGDGNAGGGTRVKPSPRMPKKGKPGA